MRGSVLAIVLIGIAATVLPGCGGDDEETTTSTTATTAESTGATGTTGASGAEGATAGAPIEDELNDCLTKLGYSVEAGSFSFDSEYDLQIDSGVAAGGADVYVYKSEKDAKAALEDIEGAYQFSEVEIVGAAALLYSEEQTEVRDDVTECVEA